MGAARDVALNELPIRGISINADAAGQSVTVVASDSGVVFVNKEDAGNVTYTLPAVADGKGKWFWFFNAVDVELIITSTAANLIGGDTTGTAATSTSNALGDCCMVTSDGSYYYFFAISGTWGVA